MCIEHGIQGSKTSPGRETWRLQRMVIDHLRQRSEVANLVHGDAMNFDQPALAVGAPSVDVVEALSPSVANEDPQHGLMESLID